MIPEFWPRNLAAINLYSDATTFIARVSAPISGGMLLGLTRSGKVQNRPEALWLDPVSLATEPRPNFWTETRIGVSSPPGE